MLRISPLPPGVRFSGASRVQSYRGCRVSRRTVSRCQDVSMPSGGARRPQCQCIRQSFIYAGGRPMWGSWEFSPLLEGRYWPRLLEQALRVGGDLAESSAGRSARRPRGGPGIASRLSARAGSSKPSSFARRAARLGSTGPARPGVTTRAGAAWARTCRVHQGRDRIARWAMALFTTGVRRTLLPPGSRVGPASGPPATMAARRIDDDET